MDISLDDLIEKERRSRQQQQREQQQRRRSGGIRRGAFAGSGGGRGGTEALEGSVSVWSTSPLATAEDLREMDAFGSAGGQGQQNVKDPGNKWRWGDARSSKGKGRSARYEPYDGGWDTGSKGGKAGKGSSRDDDWDLDDDWGPTRIIISNLDFDVMPSDLEEMLGDFGVQKAWVDYDSTDRSTGTGGAIFSSPAGAAAACRRLSVATVDGQKVFMRLDGGSGKGKGGKGANGKAGGKGKFDGKGKGWDSW